MSTYLTWVVLRIITSFIAATASSIKPFTEIENRIPIWPPSEPISDWFARMFISPWYRWDVIWYTKIVTDGYQDGDGTTNFHPLYPMLAKLISYLRLNPVFCLLIVSSSATLLLLYVYKKLASLDLDVEQSDFCVPILLLFPVSFILFAPYPEALFLFLSVSSFYLMRKNNWLISGLSAFLAVLTRQQGLFLIFPMVWELWEASGKNIKGVKDNWQSWINIVWIPLAYFLWVGYRLLVINEEIIGRYDNLQDAIYSVFISSSALEVVPYQKFVWPWEAIYLGINKFINSPDIDMWTNIMLAVIFFAFVMMGWKKMRMSYKIYITFISIISLSYHTGSTHPYMGMPRHLYLAFPVLLSITPVITQNRYIYLSYILLGIVTMSILIVEYSLTAWVP